jgi:hypothetical protein
MENIISPKYQMRLVKEIADVIWAEYKSYVDVEHYIEKWHISYDPFGNDQNFYISRKANQTIDLENTLHGIDGETLLKIAIELGVDTPDFIPSIPTFRNAIKSEYVTASATFEKAFRQIETHPDIAIGLVNSVLEGIIKEIFKDERIKTKPKDNKTLYDLTSDLLKEFQLYPGSDVPSEVKTIGSSLLAANKGIETLRSEKTNLHGKTNGDYIVEDSIYTYFVVNSVATVGLFLNSYYKKKFPPVVEVSINDKNDLPF